MATRAERHIRTALETGIRACPQSMSIGGDAPGVTLETTAPLTHALCLTSSFDLHAGPFAEAEQVLLQLLDWLSAAGADVAGGDPETCRPRSGSALPGCCAGGRTAIRRP